MKKVLATFLILLIAFTLVAEEKSLVFVWDWFDTDVTYFRYQLDSDSEEGWTVVESYETMATFSDLDLSVEHTFYLQQSYDGENWSESSTYVSEIYSEEKDFFFEEDLEEVVETRPIETTAEEVTTQETEETATVVEKNHRSFGGNGILASNIAKTSGKWLEGYLFYDSTKIHEFSEILSLGLNAKLGLGVKVTKPISIKNIAVELLGTFNVALTDKLAFEFPLGLVADYDLLSKRFGIGVGVGFDLNFFFTEKFGMKFTALAHILSSKQTFAAGGSMMIRF